MAAWKKLIYSGSDAELNNLDVLKASGSFSGSFQGEVAGTIASASVSTNAQTASVALRANALATTVTATSASTAVVDFDDYVSDADGDELSILTMPPSPTETLNTMFGGTLEPTGDLQYEYTPPAGDYPSDFILFKADDGQAQSNLAFGTFNLNGGRWAVAKDVKADDNAAAPKAFVTTVVTATDANDPDSTDVHYGVGEMYVNSDGEIWVYTGS